MMRANRPQALKTVKGLECGRSKARETQPIKPVAADVVERTIPFLNRYVASMVRIQLLTGMRSSEVTAMRAVDMDMTGGIWLYRPPHHKTSYRGKDRVIAIGPKAQEIARITCSARRRNSPSEPKRGDRCEGRNFSRRTSRPADKGNVAFPFRVFLVTPFL